MIGSPAVFLIRMLAALLVCLSICIAQTQQPQQPANPPQQPQTQAEEPPDISTAPDEQTLRDQVKDLTSALSSQGVQLLERLPPAPPTSIIRVIIGFAAFLVLAYLGGHPDAIRWERQLNVAHFTTAGLPFVILGFLASQPLIGILTPGVMVEIRPLLPFGLGWIGLTVGARFNGAALDRLPPGMGAAVFLSSALPFTLIFLSTVVLFLSLQPWSDPVLGAIPGIRDGLLLATAGSMAARSAPYFFAAATPSGEGQTISRRTIRIIELEQLAGVVGMMVISSFFRPQGGVVSWQLPGTAWLFVVFGIGTILGMLVVAVFNQLQSGPQLTAGLLGAVAFTAGMASYLRLSPIAVSCIAGAILFNLGGAWRDQVQDILTRLERPVYLLFLVLAGALWHPWDWQGWALMFLFVFARLLSKWLASTLVSRYSLRSFDPAERWTLTAAPMGALSVAIVVSAQDLYSGPTIGWIVTAVIVGTILAEVTLQIMVRRFIRVPSVEAAA